MSNDKKYSPAEVAQLVREKLQECLQKSEITSDMMKSANSSHEIDAGEEPRNDDAECPKSLGGAGANSSEGSSDGEYEESAEYSEDESMEDEVLSDYENEEDEESADKEKKEEGEEEDEEEYEFKKSEDCGYNITYKSMKKGWFDSDAPAKPAPKWGSKESQQPTVRGATAEQSRGTGDMKTNAGKLFSNMGGAQQKKPLGKDEETSGKSGNISTKRFEEGEKKMTNAGHAGVKRISQQPDKTNPEQQDYHKQMGMWRRKMTDETKDPGYYEGKHDHKFKYQEAEKSESDIIKEEIQAEMGKCGDMADAMVKKKVKK